MRLLVSKLAGSSTAFHQNHNLSSLPAVGGSLFCYVERLPNSVVDACTVNAFKARLDKFWKHQSVKFDFTADLTGT